MKRGYVLGDGFPCCSACSASTGIPTVNLVPIGGSAEAIWTSAARRLKRDPFFLSVYPDTGKARIKRLNNPYMSYSSYEIDEYAESGE